MSNATNNTNQADEYVELNGITCKVIRKTEDAIVVLKKDPLCDKAYEVTIPNLKPMDTVIRDQYVTGENQVEIRDEVIEEDVPSTVDVLPLLEAIVAEGNAVLCGNIVRNFCYKTDVSRTQFWVDTAEEIATTAFLLKQHASSSEMVATQAVAEQQRATVWSLSVYCLEQLTDLSRELYQQAFGETFINRIGVNKVGDGLKDKAPLDEVEAAHADFKAGLASMAQESGGMAALARKMAQQNNTRRASKRITFVDITPLADFLNGMMPSMQRGFLEGICDQLHPAKYSKKKADRGETAKRLINGYNPLRNANAETYLNANTAAREWELKARKSAVRLFPKATEAYAEGAAQTYLGVDTRMRIKHDAYRRSDFIGALAMAIAEGDMKAADVFADERYGYDEDEQNFILEAVAYVAEHDELPDYLQPREEIGA